MRIYWQSIYTHLFTKLLSCTLQLVTENHALYAHTQSCTRCLLAAATSVWTSTGFTELHIALGVEIFNPASSFDPIGTWSLMSRAGPTLYIAGMRGIHHFNSSLEVEVGYPPVRLAFDNMQYLPKWPGQI